MKPQSSFRPAWSRRAPSFTTPNSRTSSLSAWRRHAPFISARAAQFVHPGLEPTDSICSLAPPRSHRLSLELPSSLRAARYRRIASVSACGTMNSPRPSLGLPNSLYLNIEPTRRAPPNFLYSGEASDHPELIMLRSFEPPSSLRLSLGLPSSLRQILETPSSLRLGQEPQGSLRSA